ncbi:hypothetical protein A3H40_04345 [Candidatus Daviesbacteria bacterium RIFCSPLOWO2_02_FULL_38_15]|uniref:Glycosyltransferase RgtA/B/C/D-like domain-containing protein n=1 Tax=Candidatus Daviesbacteria bacterium RIFCSPLOWO2_02_FULL_38_15 TaxID=1797794 RepID=A0A1F5N4A4_9BACT|nr:MAG: hypothetical protein A3H40_04345 [Candidatus Daviesbacteria bacterium RIFCSPLOWO2_02_FULL_38_15]
MGYLYRGIAMSFPFVDEQYNFAIGKYLTRGEILYDDIITNHQPVTHIFSALVQEIRKPNTTFSLLTVHRDAIIIWSSIWAVLLVFFFGMSGFVFVVIYELTKSYMFGTLFLAEAIVVYPFIFSVGVIIFKEPLNKFYVILLGVLLTLAAFTLGPIWPALVFLGLFLLFRLRNNFKTNLFFLFSGILVVILFVAKDTSLTGFLYNYLYLNLVYTVPQYHASYDQQSWLVTILKALITPLFSLIKTDTTYTLWVVRLLSLLFIINLYYLLKLGKIARTILIIVLLALSNIRFVYPGIGNSGGFHLLPWYGVFIFITVAISLERFRALNYLFKALTSLIIILTIVVSLNYAKGLFLVKKDLQKEYTINYSTHTDVGQIIKIMKSPDDTIFVSPDDWLVYWQADTPHLPKLFGYYAWMSGIPELNKKILESFNSNPPTFFYCDDCKGLDLGKFLYQYKELKRNSGQTRLFILPYRIDHQTKSQLDQLKFYGVN